MLMMFIINDEIDHRGERDWCWLKTVDGLPKKEHDSAGIVQLVHLVKVWYLCDVHQVDNCKILHLYEGRHTVTI